MKDQNEPDWKALGFTIEKCNVTHKTIAICHSEMSRVDILKIKIKNIIKKLKIFN